MRRLFWELWFCEPDRWVCLPFRLAVTTFLVVGGAMFLYTLLGGGR